MVVLGCSCVRRWTLAEEISSSQVSVHRHWICFLSSFFNSYTKHTRMTLTQTAWVGSAKLSKLRKGFLSRRCHFALMFALWEGRELCSATKVKKNVDSISVPNFGWSCCLLWLLTGIWACCNVNKLHVNYYVKMWGRVINWNGCYKHTLLNTSQAVLRN